MSAYLWVVEMWIERQSGKGRWDATVGTSLWREGGRAALRAWRRRNPADKFRLRRYVPER